jgi:Flp pilus assembly protein TadG
MRTVARDQGSATLELVLLTPALVLLLLLVAAGGRLEQTRGEIDGTAREAARAASIGRTPLEAQTNATAIATTRLADKAITCQDLSVVTDTSRFLAGGSVTTTITCTVDLADLVGLTLPGSRTLQATATEPVDVFRRTGP